MDTFTSLVHIKRKVETYKTIVYSFVIFIDQNFMGFTSKLAED